MKQLYIYVLKIPKIHINRPVYYINTNEIPGELSRENLISSHVKITCYLTCENITFAMAA